MSTSLQIGTVAKLLGITQKAIRHYHKIGLLAEPPRSEGGYRLYTAHDLVRLQRIRRLQALGLSLKQIKTLLGEPTSKYEHERTLREVLQSLLEELSVEIRTLQEQHKRIKTLLDEDALDTIEQPTASPTLEWATERLGEYHVNVSASLLEQDAKVYAQLDAFNWPEGYPEGLKEMVQFFAAHPEVYQEVIALSEHIAALVDVPQDSPEVDRLIEEVTQSGDVFALMAKLSEFMAQIPQLQSPFTNVMADLTVNTLSPAQQRFLQEMARRQQKRENS